MQSRIEPESTPCCLIVEDSANDQRMLTRAVHYAQKDIRVQIANTLKDARHALTRFPISLILMENTLSDGRGVELALELSQHARFRTIPIILATDWPSPFMWHKARQAGVRHVVAKSEFGPALIRDVLNIGRVYR